MKKVMVLAVLFSALILVGCGSKTAAPADDAATDTGAQAADAAQVDGAADDNAEANPSVDLDKTTKLAECLKEKGVIMYGTEWCGHCKNQKALFGDAFAKAAYVDCDAERQTCLDAGVRGFPTWIDAQGNQYPGTQQLDKLAEIGGCEM